MTPLHTKKLRELRRNIGENIRHHRIRQKLTIHKLEQLAHINPERLDKYEIGKEEINLMVLIKISEKLKVPVKMFF